MKNSLIVLSILCIVLNASDKNDVTGCTSYFDIVSGSEHISYRETSCARAYEVLKSIKRADGIEGLKVCKHNECNQFGRLGVVTVQMLLQRMSEKTQK